MWYPNPAVARDLSYPDQVNWSTLPLQTASGKPSTFAFVLTLLQGRRAGRAGPEGARQTGVVRM